jgi:hypothetical protein
MIDLFPMIPAGSTISSILAMPHLPAIPMVPLAVEGKRIRVCP